MEWSSQWRSDRDVSVNARDTPSFDNKCDCNKLKLFVIRKPEDSPRHSTALKLVRHGLATRISPRMKFREPVLLLDPFAEKELSREDCSAKGIIVVDRSWNRLSVDKTIPAPRGKVIRRRLPPAKAGNPVNYAVPFKLSSAEALALALLILGCVKRGIDVLSLFKWGGTFLDLNRELILKMTLDHSNSSNNT